MYRQDEHVRVETQCGDPTRRFEPVRFGHGQIHDDDVRLQLAHTIDALVPRRRLSDYRESVVRLDERLDPGAEHRVIVDQENLDGFSHVSLPC